MEETGVKKEKKEKKEKKKKKKKKKGKKTRENEKASEADDYDSKEEDETVGLGETQVVENSHPTFVNASSEKPKDDDSNTVDHLNKNNQKETECLITSLSDTVLAESNNIDEQNEDQNEVSTLDETDRAQDQSHVAEIDSGKFPLSTLFDSAVSPTPNNLEEKGAQDATADSEAKELRAVLESPEHQKVIEAVKTAQKRATHYIFKTRAEKAKEHERIAKERAILRKRKMDLDYQFKPKKDVVSVSKESYDDVASVSKESYDDVISSSIFQAAQNINLNATNNPNTALMGSLPEPPISQSIIESGPVVLDVGGRQFSTLAETMLKYNKRGLIASILLGKKKGVYTQSGALFFDSDPIIFENILDWYRCGKLHYDNTNKIITERVKSACKYFQIFELVFKTQKKKTSLDMTEEAPTSVANKVVKGYSFGTQYRLLPLKNQLNKGKQFMNRKRIDTKIYNFRFNEYGFSDRLEFTTPAKSSFTIYRIKGLGRLMMDVSRNRDIREVSGAIIYDSNLYFWLKPQPSITFEVDFPGGYRYNLYLAKPMVTDEALKTIEVEIECAIKPLEEKPSNGSVKNNFGNSRSLPVLE